MGDVSPVVVVGAGPVGLALAADLGWRGIPCVVVEQGDGSVLQPKMDMVGVRTMEFCRRWGIVGDVERCPYPRDYPQDIVFLTRLDEPELSRDVFPSMAEDRPPAESPQKRERCPQNMFDPILRRFAQSFRGTEFRYGTVVHTAQERPDGSVDLELRSERGASKLRARYVVACDGGGSAIRERLGIKMSGQRVLTFTNNILFRCADFHRRHAVAPAYRYIFVEGGRVWATIVAINGRDQWRMSIVGDAERKTLDEAGAREAVLRAAGFDLDLEILSIVGWTRRELVADEYRRGSIFLCGDACHVMSPTGGFGMNTGIGDALDLSWKLAAVLEGWGGPHLLGSYQDERRPVALRNVAEASANLERMLRIDPAAGCDDREFGQRLAQTMSAEWRTIGIHLGYRYEHSPICLPDGSPAVPDTARSYLPSARPGGRAPHVWLADGRSTLDLFGRHFTLLRFGADPADVQSLVDLARRIGIPMGVVDIADPAAVAAYERRLALVRPDGHVAWRGDALPDDVPALLDHVRGGVPDTVPQRREQKEAIHA